MFSGSNAIAITLWRICIQTITAARNIVLVCKPLDYIPKWVAMVCFGMLDDKIPDKIGWVYCFNVNLLLKNVFSYFMWVVFRHPWGPAWNQPPVLYYPIWLTEVFLSVGENISFFRLIYILFLSYCLKCWIINFFCILCFW